MKRWAHIHGGVVINVVEQADAPRVGGDWIEVTGRPVGPGCKYLGGAWEPAPGPARCITVYAFWSRWQTAERRNLLTVAQTEVAALDFVQMVDRAQYIDLDDPLWVQAMPQLVALGVLEPARAEDILSAPVLDRERP